MARIAGVDLPREKKILYALPYIFGIGSNNAKRILAETGVNPDARVRELRDAGGLEIEPKQAWTNVADFTANGIDAVNFGPGHTAYAHRRDELVEVAALVHAYETLHRFLGGPMREDAG